MLICYKPTSPSPVVLPFQPLVFYDPEFFSRARMDIMKSIRELLSLLGPSTPLGMFCQKVEGELYLWAKSREEYHDRTTLMKRAVRTLDRIYTFAQRQISVKHTYTSPTSLQTQSLNNLKLVTDPEVLKRVASDECAICLESLSSQNHQQQHHDHHQQQQQHQQHNSLRHLKQQHLVELPCGHFFHFGCIQESIQKHGPRCPMTCMKMVGPVQGKCPSGTMTVTHGTLVGSLVFVHTGYIV